MATKTIIIDKDNVIAQINSDIEDLSNNLDSVSDSVDSAQTAAESAETSAASALTAATAATQAVDEALSGKADTTVTDGLQTQVTQNSDDIALKADQTDLDTLSSTVSTNTASIQLRATKAELQALSDTVDTKADQTDLDAANTAISENSDAIDSTNAAIQLRATKTELQTLSDTVDTKADQTSLDTTNTAVSDNTDAISQNAVDIQARALQTSLDTTNTMVATKADQTDLDSAVSDIEQNATNIALKADQTDLDTTNATLATKADQTDLDTLEERVLQNEADIANIPSDVTDLAQSVEDNTTAIATKADQTDLDTLSSTVDTKADQADFDTLSSAVDNKVDQTDFDALGVTVALKTDKYNAWSSLTGSLNQGSVVSHNSIDWFLVNDLSDVTTSEPSYSNDDWKELTNELKTRNSVENFIASGKSSGGTGTRIEFSEFYTDSGVGGGIWEKTGNTGTASQAPSQTGSATFVDSDGYEYELVGKHGDLFRKLGAKVDNSTDDYLVINAIVTEINNGNIDGELLILGSIKCSTNPDTITKGYKLSGIGQYSKFFWDDCDGFKHDIEDDYANAQLLWSNFSYTTNGAGTRTGVEYYANYTDGYGPRLIFKNVFFMPEGLSIGASVSDEEWLTAGVFGDTDRKTSELHFLDVAVYGASVNSTYDGLTSSNGFVFTDVTGARFDRPKIFLLGEAGLSFNGQTEGSIIDTATIVACRNGIEYLNLTSPCHNHVVNNTHMGVYERGIKTEDNATISPLSCLFDNLFILEREETLSKTNGFVGAELYTRASVISNSVVWCNGTSVAGSTEKIGYRVSSASNIIDACKVKLTRYAVDIVELSDDDYSSQMTDVDVSAVVTGTESLYTGSLTPSGKFIKTDGLTRYQQQVIREEISYLNSSLEEYFNVGTDGINLTVDEDSTGCIYVTDRDTGDTIVQIRSNGGAEWGSGNSTTTSIQHDFRTLNSDYDVRFNISGGDADTSGLGGLQIICNNLNLSASGTVNTTSTYSVGGTQVITSQQDAISDATGTGDTDTINSILSALRNHGLIASS